MEKFRGFISSEKSGKNAVFNYRIGLTSYGEQLSFGMPFALGFNGGGYNLRPDMMVANGAFANIDEAKSFIVELDGQSLTSHLELIDVQEREEDGIMNVRVTLRHEKRPVQITVCTKYDGSDCFSRWLEIKNCSEKPVAMTRLAVLSGVLERTENWKSLMQDDEQSPYRLGYFEYAQHMHEGQFKWHGLHGDCYSFGGRYARARYRHPFCLLENKAKGTAYAIQMAYSGGYRFSFDFMGTGNDKAGHLAYVCELEGTNPIRVIDAGETVVSPEVIISMVNGDADMAIQAQHEHIRKAVMMRPHGEGCYTETACGGNIESMKAGALRAKQNGFDIVYVDAGWYFPEGLDALGCTGKWEPDSTRFPNGIRELTDYCHSIGIKFGLWMEPERIGSLCEKWSDEEKAKCLNTYYDRIPGAYPGRDKDGNLTTGRGGCYDLSRPEVAEYIENEICKMIDMSGIDMFRLDFNTSYYAPVSYNMKDGWLESADMRYCENFAAMFGRIREKYPDVIFENCASGGGRTDLQCVKYFDHTWVTDNPVAPRSFAITNGMTMCLPPELVDRLVTTMDAPKYASLDFNLFQLMFVRPTSHFPRENPKNPVQTAYFERFMKLYNEFARPMLPTCKIYHHTPSQNDCEPKGIGILEAVSKERDKAMLGVFALADPKKAEETVRFKGIDATKRYKVSAVEANETFEVSGYELKYKGISVFLRGALTAELFLAEEIK